MAKMQYESGGSVEWIFDNIHPSQVHRLIDAVWVMEYLRVCCHLIRMTPISAPLIFHVNEPNGGLSGVLPIKESHICAHTWPESSALRLEIDTCKEPIFDIGLIEQYTVGVFGHKTRTRRKVSWWNEAS